VGWAGICCQQAGDGYPCCRQTGLEAAGPAVIGGAYTAKVLRWQAGWPQTTIPAPAYRSPYMSVRRHTATCKASHTHNCN
jgi:hypothetical protein